MWGSKCSGEREMNKPEDIVINSNHNNRYVTDTKNSRIIEFTLKKSLIYLDIIIIKYLI